MSHDKKDDMGIVRMIEDMEQEVLKQKNTINALKVEKQEQILAKLRMEQKLEIVRQEKYGLEIKCVKMQLELDKTQADLQLAVTWSKMLFGELSKRMNGQHLQELQEKKAKLYQVKKKNVDEPMGDNQT